MHPVGNYIHSRASASAVDSTWPKSCKNFRDSPSKNVLAHLLLSIPSIWLPRQWPGRDFGTSNDKTTEKHFRFSVVARRMPGTGLEPVTHGFSVHCSTN